MVKKRVLVIEDNPLNMQLLLDLLQVEGYYAVGAATAEEGLCLAKSDSLDLIVTDIGLPGMDGLAAARDLKADPKTRHIPTIAVSATAREGGRPRALAAGCEACLPKPLQVDEFLKTVARCLEQEPPDK